MPPRKVKKFDLGQAARQVAREVIGQPSKTRVIPDKRNKKPKHRKAQDADHNK